MISTARIAEYISPSRFEFIHLRDAEVLHSVAALDGYVYVIGHPESAVYEWIDATAPASVRFSNMGYGEVAVALRDGLIVAYDGLSSTDDEALKAIGGKVEVPKHGLNPSPR